MCNPQISILILIVVIILLFYYLSPTVERYGGPIKRVVRIPKEIGYERCRQYYQKCMYDFRYTPGAAHTCERNYNSCIAELNYSDFHRL